MQWQNRKVVSKYQGKKHAGQISLTQELQQLYRPNCAEWVMFLLESTKHKVFPACKVKKIIDITFWHVVQVLGKAVSELLASNGLQLYTKVFKSESYPSSLYNTICALQVRCWTSWSFLNVFPAKFSQLCMFCVATCLIFFYFISHLMYA